MSLKLHLMRYIAVALFLMVAGCGTATKENADSKGASSTAMQPLSDMPMATPRRVTFGVAVGRFDPVLGIEPEPTSGSSSIAGDVAFGAARITGGAAVGAGSCLRLLAPHFFLVMACLPFGAAAGAVVGAVAVAGDVISPKQSASTKAAQTEEEKIASVEKRTSSAKALEIHRRLSDEMSRFLLASGIHGIEVLRDQGPRSRDERPRYVAGPDYVVEIGITDLKATTPDVTDRSYRFVLYAQGRLVRVADNDVVEEFTRVVRTRSATVEGWTAQQGEALSVELGYALREIAQTFIYKWIDVNSGELRL